MPCLSVLSRGAISPIKQRLGWNEIANRVPESLPGERKKGKNHVERDQAA